MTARAYSKRFNREIDGPRTCRDVAREDQPEHSHGVACAVAPIAPPAATGPGENHTHNA